MNRDMMEILKNLDSGTLDKIMKLRNSPEGEALTRKIRNADKNELMRLVKSGVKPDDPDYMKKLYDILEGK